MLQQEVQHVAHQPVALLPGGQFRTLVADIRIDVTVQYDGSSPGQPLPDLRREVGPVTGKQQRHKIGIDLPHPAELAPQEAGDQFAVDRSVEAREMDSADYLMWRLCIVGRYKQYVQK